MTTQETKKFDLGAVIYNNEIAMVFDTIENHGVQFSSSITDNWLENNTAVHNAITINPIQITLSGLVGEVVFTPPHTWREFITDKLNSTKLGADFTNKLSVIPALIPDVDNYTQLAKNAVDYAENAFNHYKGIYQTIQNIWQHKEYPTQKKQAVVLQKLMDAWKNRTQFTIQTPWKKFEKMYILNGNFTQGETNTVTNISITLKQLNFAELNHTEANKEVLDKYNSYAKAQSEAQKQGKAKSILKTWRTFG